MKIKNEPSELLNDVFPFNSGDALQNFVPYLINRLASRLASDQSPSLLETGLSAPMMRIISALNAFGTLTINELTVLTITEQSTTSRAVHQLVEQGMVERKIEETDQRVRSVEITNLGRKKLKEIAPLINTNYERLVDGIAPDELSACIKAMRKMVDNICETKI